MAIVHDGSMTSAPVPPSGEADPELVSDMADLLRRGDVTVLTGAGCSTESGIPDYRGEGATKKARAPVKFTTFVRDPMARRRYWARSSVGWRQLTEAVPNPAHEALAKMEQAGLLTGLITQNVDGLHRRAGHENIIELHGGLEQVRCLSCSKLEPREELQGRLLELNPKLTSLPAVKGPDGEPELDDELVLGFEVATCQHCNGHLKPDVVFFGESVPRDRVENAYDWIADSRMLLVAGTSLTLLSGLRFVKRAKEQGKLVGIINLGPTRGDEFAEVKVEARLGQALPEIVEVLGI